MTALAIASQIASLVGAFLILIAYFGLQLGKVDGTSNFYLFCNALGGLLLFLAAIITGNFGFILLEGMWVAVTVYGWIKKTVKNRGGGGAK